MLNIRTHRAYIGIISNLDWTEVLNREQLLLTRVVITTQYRDQWLHPHLVVATSCTDDVPCRM